MHPITLQSLRDFPRLLESHYAAIPTDFVDWKPPTWDGIPSEHYTAIEQICHILDIEVEGYQVRLRRTVEEDCPFLPSIDGDVLASQRSYSKANAQDVFARLRVARARTVEYIAGLAPEDFDRPAEFEGYGPVTLRSLVHYLCSHDQQHLAGLQWLLGQISAVPASKHQRIYLGSPLPID